MRIIDREVVRKPLSLSDPEHLSAGKMDHSSHGGSLGG
jgi:hypothetical protein